MEATYTVTELEPLVSEVVVVAAGSFAFTGTLTGVDDLYLTVQGSSKKQIAEHKIPRQAVRSCKVIPLAKHLPRSSWA